MFSTRAASRDLSSNSSPRNASTLEGFDGSCRQRLNHSIPEAQTVEGRSGKPSSKWKRLPLFPTRSGISSARAPKSSPLPLPQHRALQPASAYAAWNALMSPPVSSSSSRSEDVDMDHISANAIRQAFRFQLFNQLGKLGEVFPLSIPLAVFAGRVELPSHPSTEALTGDVDHRTPQLLSQARYRPEPLNFDATSAFATIDAGSSLRSVSVAMPKAALYQSTTSLCVRGWYP